MRYDFRQHRKGDTFNGVQFQVKVNGVNKNLTGATIKAVFVKGVLQYTLESTNAQQISISDPVNGIWQINKQVISWESGMYNYQVQFTFPNGDVKTYLEGSFVITKDIVT